MQKWMMGLFVLAVVLLLSFYGVSRKPPEQDFQAEFERQHIDLHVETYESRKDLHRAYRTLVDRSDMNEDRRAFAQWTSGDAVQEPYFCTIHVVEPSPGDVKEVDFGHELLHCVYGRWHDTDDYHEKPVEDTAS